MEYKYMEEEKKVAALDNGKEIGVISYSEKNEEVWIFDHTYVDPDYRGGAIADTLLKNLVDIAKEKGVQIVPQCSYVRRKFDKNPEYQELEYKG